MKLNDMTIEQLAMTNMTMLAGKLFHNIDCVDRKKMTYYNVQQVVVDYKRQTIEKDWVKEVPVYKDIYKPISYKQFKKYPEQGENLAFTETETLTFENEYNRILDSKIFNKPKALNQLAEKFYALSGDVIERFNSFGHLDKSYVVRVKDELKPAMKHYVEEILPEKIKFERKFKK